ncbi:hypothetical protein [Jannaschia seohaensis]|uniref:Alpha-glucoside transport system substrate-binding protein n=1 Tax=Jannaschia seohaensis TaxID=475081 RepID=A0A2Y9AKG4_9RHOB|nr:hypothetical protein [Jannaschia seohaensis]PWJ20559.1 alpha-glucoside transport system substrate-binding protein [Jannaschia seohaensis]SSA44655.1 alpha-glucoside transport system substrate-binding protein [Jannaschia seohaensis]
MRGNGSDAFERQIVIDVEAGSPPNIAVSPEPGLLCDPALRGRLADLGGGTASWMTETDAAGSPWTALGLHAGLEAFFGSSYNVNVRPLVWSRSETFDDLDYGLLRSMGERRASTERMVEDEAMPRCIGIGSGATSG